MIGAQSHKTWLNKFLYSGNLQLSCKSPWRHKMQLYYAGTGMDCFFMICFLSLNRRLLPHDQFRMADGLLNYFPLFCFCLFSSKTCKQCFFFILILFHYIPVGVFFLFFLVVFWFPFHFLRQTSTS
jgi:hypothetical protein